MHDALASGDARILLNVDLPEVPPGERGALLGQILGAVGGASFQRLDLCLDSCRQAWPGAFDAGAAGARRAGGAALAGALGVSPTSRRPGSRTSDGCSGDWASTSPKAGGSSPTPWPPRSWPPRRGRPGSTPGGSARASCCTATTPGGLLAIDARLDGLAGPDPGRRCGPGSVGREARQVGSGRGRAVLRGRPERLRRPRPGRVRPGLHRRHQESDRSLGPLPWWPASRTAGATDDLRDGFARIRPHGAPGRGGPPGDPPWIVGPAGRPARRPDGRRARPDPAGGGRRRAGARHGRHVDPDLSHLSPDGPARWRMPRRPDVLARPGIGRRRAMGGRSRVGSTCDCRSTGSGPTTGATVRRPGRSRWRAMGHATRSASSPNGWCVRGWTTPTAWPTGPTTWAARCRTPCGSAAWPWWASCRPP